MSDWLNRIDVASPCHESWDEMNGDQRERHCDRCEQSVFDLSGLDRQAAMDLVRRSQGGEEICVRFKRRADGTVLTADCPTQVRQTRSRWTPVRRVAAGLFALAGGLAAGCDSDATLTVTPARALPMAQTQPSASCCDGSGDCCAPSQLMGAMVVEMGEVVAPEDLVTPEDAGAGAGAEGDQTPPKCEESDSKEMSAEDIRALEQLEELEELGSGQMMGRMMLVPEDKASPEEALDDVLEAPPEDNAAEEGK